MTGTKAMQCECLRCGCLVSLSEMNDVRGYDTFGLFFPSSGKGVLINDDKEHFG